MPNLTLPGAAGSHASAAPTPWPSQPGTCARPQPSSWRSPHTPPPQAAQPSYSKSVASQPAGQAGRKPAPVTACAGQVLGCSSFSLAPATADSDCVSVQQVRLGYAASDSVAPLVWAAAEGGCGARQPVQLPAGTALTQAPPRTHSGPSATHVIWADAPSPSAIPLSACAYVGSAEHETFLAVAARRASVTPARCQPPLVGWTRPEGAPTTGRPAATPH